MVKMVAGTVYQSPYLNINMKQFEDGVYPHLETPPATMTLPWRRNINGSIEICLLIQARVDSDCQEVVKISGGYNRDLNDVDAALLHTRNKLGLVPGEYPLVFWRECLGCGPQYNFPIKYSFLQEPKDSGTPLKSGCERRWLDLTEACRLATAKDSQFFDDFSTAQLLILLINQDELCK